MTFIKVLQAKADKLVKDAEELNKPFAGMLRCETCALLDRDGEQGECRKHYGERMKQELQGVEVKGNY